METPPDRIGCGHATSLAPHGKGFHRTASCAAKPAIPDLRARNDEIGDLSGALVEMTAALWQRLDAIERFAADVAHEIRNPLTSLKSAVETASRVTDPERREKLMQIIVEDVQRIVNETAVPFLELARGQSAAAEYLPPDEAALIWSWEEP